MNFINNWLRGITLEVGVTECALDLPDGTYRLTIADSATALATVWEIVEAVVVDGTATLTRGMEGTLERNWPEGSVIYAGITAGMLSLFSLGGGAEVVTGEDPPALAPPSVGALYIAPAGPAYIALGSDFPEQWAQVLGEPAPYNYDATTAGTTNAVPREARAARVGVADGSAAEVECTLELPEWPVLPHGFVIDAMGSAANPMTVHVDLADALPAGVVATYIGGEDFDSGATISRVGDVLTIETDHPVRLTLVGLRSYLDMADELNAEVSISLARLPYTGITFIDLP